MVKSSANFNTIYIGDTQIQLFFDTLKAEGDKGISYILVDENTQKYCLPVLLKKTPFLCSSQIIKISSGEIHKNLETCKFVWETLTKSGAERDSLLINLGGGVLCDMGGFIASTYKRGIKFINIPTTLLAMTDASLGGKTGIDFNGLKNQLGVFNAPLAVCILSDFLNTLDKRQISNGFAEIIKHALISDVNYWNKIKNSKPENYAQWDEIITESVGTKMSITEQDPFEKNIRKKLNFGHTIGHAIESWSLEHDENFLLHGEAVAIGMICETYLSYKTNNLPELVFKEITDYLFQVFLKYHLKENVFGDIVKLMFQDKKNTSGKINFSLLSAIGECDINMNCSEQLIIESLEFYNKNTKP